MQVWSTRYAGMYGDDLAKVTHIARIAGSVYSDIFGNGYYMESHNQPRYAHKHAPKGDIENLTQGRGGVPRQCPTWLVRVTTRNSSLF